MALTRAALALVAMVAVGVVALSGGSGADPETPAGLPGTPPPFLGTAVAGSGELTAAVDAYGDVVDLRPGPAGAALIENPAGRQAAGTVAADTGIVPRVSVGGGDPLPLWEADMVEQRYLPGTNVVRTLARFGAVRVAVTVAAAGRTLAVVTTGTGTTDVSVAVNADRAGWSLCRRRCGERVVEAAARADRRWLEQARPLGSDSPPWAVAMYERSLLTLRALTDRETGAVAAGARDGWAYVWPRDAATAAIAFAAAGYGREAELAARFLLGAGLEEAARFHGDGSPVPDRVAQGDAIGWAAAAAAASGLIASARHAAKILSQSYPVPWRDRADYQEGEAGDYLGNALASGGDVTEFEPLTAFDSATAWAVRPFSRPAYYPQVRRALKALVAGSSKYGITPGEGWHGGVDPWTAPTAWTAWSLAALGERGEALQLLANLRRAATPAGALPERVDVRTGVPTSTTPLAWSHAFAILALRELWP